MITEMHDPADGRKPRTYAGRAHKDHLNLVRKKKNTAKTIRKAIGKQLRYLRRDLAIIDTMLSHKKHYPENGRFGWKPSAVFMNSKNTCTTIIPIRLKIGLSVCLNRI
nr:hypothetical protein [Acetobacterium tundrae]